MLLDGIVEMLHLHLRPMFFGHCCDDIAGNSDGVELVGNAGFGVVVFITTTFILDVGGEPIKFEHLLAGQLASECVVVLVEKFNKA